jgi:CRISPR/Cas system-associated exonuclease Cas4 (RecB family)
MKAVLRRGGLFRQYICEISEPCRSSHNPTFARTLKDARRNLKCNDCRYREICKMKRR